MHQEHYYLLAIIGYYINIFNIYVYNFINF